MAGPVSEPVGDSVADAAAEGPVADAAVSEPMAEPVVERAKGCRADLLQGLRRQHEGGPTDIHYVCLV